MIFLCDYQVASGHILAELFLFSYYENNRKVIFLISVFLIN